MTKGVNAETLDGLRWKYFEMIAERLLIGNFKFSPSRRIFIPKPGKTTLRPLSIGTPREKIVQKALQVLLEAIFEPKFLACSYGFRPNRSISHALERLYLVGKNYQWVIQGDISKCFDEIPHKVIMDNLRAHIKCERTLSLIAQHLTVGYMDPDNGKVVRNVKGTPQGSVISPLLSNLVLHSVRR
jgi:RNA-directed DNA polymerase